MLDEEDAVEVIDFVAEGASQEIFAADFKGFSFGVLRFYSDKLGAQDVAAETWDGEAAFFFALFAFSVNDLWICEYDFCFGIFSAGYIDHGQAQVQADLRGGESDALGSVHGGEHIFGQLLEFGVEFLYGRGGFLEDGVSIFDNGIDLARRGNGFRRGGLRDFRTRRFVGHSYRNSASFPLPNLLQIFAEKHRLAQGLPLLHR